MASSRRMADLGYQVFSGSMMLLTLYGGYLCSVRAYQISAAENQTEAIIKD